MYGVVYFLFFTCADQIAYNNIGTQSQTGKQADQERYYRGIGANSRHGIGTGELSHNSQISGVKELLEHAAEGEGNGEKKYFFGQRAMYHIRFGSFHGK